MSLLEKVTYIRSVWLDLVTAVKGRQDLDHVTGVVSFPFTAKSKMKRSFAQQGEDLILDRIITRVLWWDITKPRNYVDVGAFDAISHSGTYLLYLRGWNGIVLDPSVESSKTFRRWRPKDTFIRSVVGKDDGVDVDFYIPNKDKSDQSLTATKYPTLLFKEKSRKVTVPQVNLNKELCRQGISKIHVLNIDVEGAELEIIEDLDFDVFKPSIIAIEIHGNDLLRCFESRVAKILFAKGYRAAGSAVITQFFVREDDIPLNRRGGII